MEYEVIKRINESHGDSPNLGFVRSLGFDLTNIIMEDNNEEIKKNDTTESTDTVATTQKPRTPRKKKVVVEVVGQKIDLLSLSKTAKEGLCNNIHEWKRTGSLNVKIRTAMIKNLGLDIKGWSRDYSVSGFVKSMNEAGEKIECSDEHGKPCCS